MQNEQIIGRCGPDQEREYQPDTDGLIEAMGMAGDVKTVWDPNKPDEVESAKATFDRLIGKGYKAYLVKKGGDGEKGEQIGKFDPKAGHMILVPAMVGG